MPPLALSWFHEGVVVSTSATPLPVWTPCPVRVPPIGLGPVISTEFGSGAAASVPARWTRWRYVAAEAAHGSATRPSPVTCWTLRMSPVAASM